MRIAWKLFSRDDRRWGKITKRWASLGIFVHRWGKNTKQWTSLEKYFPGTIIAKREMSVLCECLSPTNMRWTRKFKNHWYVSKSSRELQIQPLILLGWICSSGEDLDNCQFCLKFRVQQTFVGLEKSNNTDIHQTPPQSCKSNLNYSWVGFTAMGRIGLDVQLWDAFQWCLNFRVQHMFVGLEIPNITDTYPNPPQRCNSNLQYYLVGLPALGRI